MEKFANNFSTTLASAAGSGDGTLSTAAASPSTLQGGEFRIRVDDEIMIVTSGQNTTTWVVTRGAEGTAAAAHSSGAKVTHVLTAGSLLLPVAGFARIERTSSQTIPGSTDTPISWSSAPEETGGDFWDVSNPTRVLFPETRLYAVSPQVNFAANATGYRWVHLRRNGAAASTSGNRGLKIPTIASVVLEMGFTDFIRMSAGDYLEVFVRQNSGGNLGFDNSAGQYAFVEVLMLGS